LDELPAARTATLIREESGFGEYNASQLEKYLADKDVKFESYIGRNFEGMRGESSSADLEYLLQLIRLAFTAPRFDEEAFESVRSRLTSSVANRDRSPQTLFSDTLNRLLSNASPRREPFTLESVAEMDLPTSERIYRERFSNAADFTLVFVGNVDPGELASLAEIYLANLPASPEREETADRGIRPVAQPVEETLYKGIEEQATAALIFNRPMTWSEKSAVLTNSTASILENILGERIREALGGTYSISAWGNLYRRPYEYAEAGIYFGTDPSRVGELVDAVLEITRELAARGPEQRFIDNAEEAYRRSYEEQLRENSFWLNHLESSLQEDEDPDDLLTPAEYADIIDSEAVRLQAGEIYRPADLIEVRLLPEN
jgi:zinc protease